MPMWTEKSLGDRHEISIPNPQRLFSFSDQTNLTRTDKNDRYLMRRLAHGDETAFWYLWERYRFYLYVCCSR